MIVKKIENPKKASSKAERVSALSEYVRDPKKEDPLTKMKCIYSGARGFITDKPHSQEAEMLALAQESVRSRDPITHYVLSWQEGEHPSIEQAEEAVSIFLDELGLTEHQVVYGLHGDTDNIHLHIVVNRVHPDTLKVIKPNRGFDREAGHKAIAMIEHAQGWKRQDNGRYQLLENGEFGRAAYDPDKPREPDQKQRDMEQRTGEKSETRIAIEDGAPIIKQATSWKELHRQLAEKGMRYEKTGSGAVLFVGDVGVKASSADRNASLSKLEKRLGVYEAPPARQQVAKRAPEPIEKDVPGWETYIQGRTTHYAAKDGATVSLRQRQEAARKQLSASQKGHRETVFKGSWKGKGELLNAMRSVVAAEQAAQNAALKEQQQKERTELREKYRPYPDLEQWQRQQGNPELADQWRYRASAPQRLQGDTTEPPTLRDIRAYEPKIQGDQVHYSRKAEAGRGGGVSFVDKGKEIDINNFRDRESVIAAMQLSAQKWPKGITVNGNQEYKALCVSLAAEHGFKINNPELQTDIQAAREKLHQERAHAMKSEQVKAFKKYHDAVGAERYRVTSIRMKPDGGKMTFILDKKEGITRGFTPEEIEQRTPEMQRLQRRGENLYYTPLSTSRHHILIDDMDKARLEKLTQDGYTPAVVLESSPGNYQAIVTIPKLGTDHDKDVGNRLAEQLNRTYGDPKLSGCVHPHRAPGYENRKPKHEREDGTYPEVRLITAEGRECVKTLALSSQINADYERQAIDQVQRPATEKQPNAVNLVSAPGTAIDAYQRHLKDVLQRQKGAGGADLSRVDSMIAVRMRVTGHDQADIEGALAQCAPLIRKKDEGRDWNDYAQRTAKYAFGAAGDRQAANLGKYRQQWEKLEGRAVLQPTPPVLQPLPPTPTQTQGSTHSR